MTDAADIGTSPIILTNDKVAAALEIIVWTAYPFNVKFRNRGISAIQDWARWRTRSSRVGRKTRVEAALWRLEHELDRHLLAGEIFRRQVLKLQYDDSIFGSPSTRSFANRIADDPESTYLDPRNVIRDYWSRAKPIHHLSVGICYGLVRRPTLETLVFSDFEWVDRAVRRAEQFRTFALEVGHPLAGQLRPIEIII